MRIQYNKNYDCLLINVDEASSYSETNEYWDPVCVNTTVFIELLK